MSTHTSSDQTTIDRHRITSCDTSALLATDQHSVQDLLLLLTDNENIAQSQATDTTRALSSRALSTTNTSALCIKSFVDGRGLACPLPLLKTKVALRQIAEGESLYVVATDPNSQADIIAFCAQSQQTSTTSALALSVKTTTSSLSSSVDSNLATSFDTIYHFIITKTDSN